jgi:hypothetical protein
VSRHPQNGPTFTKAPPKKQQPLLAPSSARVRAQLEETMRDAADRKLMATNPRAWLQKHNLLSKNKG